MIPAFASSHFILALVMGACAAIGLFHVWFWQRGRGQSSHLWVAGFCACAILFQLGRYLEVQSMTAEPAVRAGRLQVAVVPFLIFCLLGFARTLREGSPGRLYHGLHLVAAGALSWLAFSTDFMISDTTFLGSDWFGYRHQAPVGAPGIAALALYAVPAYVHLVLEVKRSPRISRLEKQVVIGSVVAFAVMGTATAAGAVTSVGYPSTAQPGALVIAAGLSFLLVHQHRRMRDELELMAEARARQLQETDARYRQLVDDAPVGIVALDRDGRLLVANPSLLRMIGAPDDLIRTKGVGRVRFLAIPRVVESGIADRLNGCLEDGQSFVDELELGSEWVGGSQQLRLSVAAIRDTAGAIAGVQAIVEDIGERKRLQAQLQQSQKMEAVGGLAAGIAHEINNPMSYVRANLSMLRDEWRDACEKVGQSSPAAREQLGECEELIDDALEGVERTVTIVREVNEFAHGQSDGKQEVDLNELLEDSLRTVTARIGDGIEIERHYGELPKVFASPGQLVQVFLNLVVNAVQALGETGRLRLESELLEHEGEIAVRVVDDGPGISPDHLDRVFDPFFTTKAAGEGTGLGLYICYEIIRLHEGSIHVKSEPGVGTAFEIRLPV